MDTNNPQVAPKIQKICLYEFINKHGFKKTFPYYNDIKLCFNLEPGVRNKKFIHDDVIFESHSKNSHIKRNSESLKSRR